MSRTVAIPDELYSELEQEARSSGLPIEQVFENWLREAIRRIEETERKGKQIPVRPEEEGDEQVDRG